MSLSDRLRKDVERRFWRAGLSVACVPERRCAFCVEGYPDWRVRCFQTGRWHLWSLFEQAQLESPFPEGFFSLITVDRRDDSAVATFELTLLECWLGGGVPFVIPRRKRRVGFSHHRALQELQENGCLPMLVSRQTHHRVLVSVPLSAFKAWLQRFPPPHASASQGQQLALTLWERGVRRTAEAENANNT